MMKNIPKLLLAISFCVSVASCSINDMYVRVSLIVMESKILALNHETDYEMVRDTLPENIESLENLLLRDTDNAELHIHAANAYYVYAFGFVEDMDKRRASGLYYRGFDHGKQALKRFGISHELLNGPTDKLEHAIQKLDKHAIDALFFTALCWSKYIEMNAAQLVGMIQLHKVVILMQQVQVLDDQHRMGGANMFFGTYYGSRPPIMGGDYNKSRSYFEKARKQNQNKLLIVDFLQARYLFLQQGNREEFHNSLKKIINTTDNLLPEQALLNAIARKKAAYLLDKEDQLFEQGKYFNQIAY